MNYFSCIIGLGLVLGVTNPSFGQWRGGQGTTSVPTFSPSHSALPSNGAMSNVPSSTGRTNFAVSTPVQGNVAQSPLQSRPQYVRVVPPGTQPGQRPSSDQSDFRHRGFHHHGIVSA